MYAIPVCGIITILGAILFGSGGVWAWKVRRAIHDYVRSEEFTRYVDGGCDRAFPRRFRSLVRTELLSLLMVAAGWCSVLLGVSGLIVYGHGPTLLLFIFDGAMMIGLQRLMEWLFNQTTSSLPPPRPRKRRPLPIEDKPDRMAA